MSMSVKWCAHLKGSDKENFQKFVRSNSDLLRRLDQILTEDLEETYLEMSQADSYQTPAWAEKQADRLGKIRTLRKVKDLINIWS